jgi:tetratricopeptide (TPR) repeat protein
MLFFDMRICIKKIFGIDRYHVVDVVLVYAMFLCTHTYAFAYTPDILQDRPALEIINQALESNPNSEELLRVRAEVYEIMGEYANAIADYSRLTQLVPDEERFWYLLGHNQFLNNDMQAAMINLNKATRLNTNYLPAFHTKIRVLMQLNQNEAALRVSDSTLRIAATAMNYFLQGEVNSRLRQWQKAEWAYQSATRVDPGFIDAYIAWANVAATTNKRLEALEAAEMALTIDPDSNQALIVRSRALALASDYFNAIEDVSYVIDVEPDNIDAYYWRATYYMKQNMAQEAIQDFDFVLDKQPENWQAIGGRADAYALIGNVTIALEGYQKLLQIAENYSERDAIRQFANRQISSLN